jgi:hypothetical protein
MQTTTRTHYPIYDPVHGHTNFFSGTQPVYLVTIECPVETADGRVYQHAKPYILACYLLKHKALTHVRALSPTCGNYCCHKHILRTSCLQDLPDELRETLMTRKNPDELSAWRNLEITRIYPPKPPDYVAPKPLLIRYFHPLQSTVPGLVDGPTYQADPRYAFVHVPEPTP